MWAGPFSTHGGAIDYNILTILLEGHHIIIAMKLYYHIYHFKKEIRRFSFKGS